MWDLTVSVSDHCLSFYFTADSFSVFMKYYVRNCI